MQLIEETGNRYSRLLVIGRAGKNKDGNVRWLCCCDCGNQVTVVGVSLRRGRTKSCGCLQKQRTAEIHTKNEMNNRYGKLTVVEYAGGSKGGAQWLCQCDCGIKIVVLADSLRRGNTRSCGCLHKETVSLSDGEAGFNALFTSYRRAARKRSLNWNLTKSQVRTIVLQPCRYCNSEPSQTSYTHGMNGVFLYNGIDRIDNEQGYIESNVAPCCKTCNYAKHGMSTEEFADWISRAYSYWASKQ